MLFYIHPCPFSHLYPDVAFCYLALNLLNNVAVSLLTLSSVFPCVLLVFYVPYGLALAILSFIIMPSYCWMPSHAMKCFVISDLSSRRCLHNSVYVMLSFSAKSESVYETCYVYMCAIISSVPFRLVISKGLLIYAFSIFTPWICFLWYVLVSCCLLSLNIASWYCFWHVSIFTVCEADIFCTFAMLVWTCSSVI